MAVPATFTLTSSEDYDPSGDPGVAATVSVTVENGVIKVTLGNGNGKVLRFSHSDVTFVEMLKWLGNYGS